MAKIIAIVAGICVIIAAGVAVYFNYSKPNENVKKFAETSEKNLNGAMNYINMFINSDTTIRNNVKLKFKPIKCIAKNSKVICNSERLYIGAPFSSVDFKNNQFIIDFVSESKVIMEVSSNGVFEIESNPYTNAFKTDVGGKCSYISTYDKENGVFDTVVSDCKSNFGSLILNIIMEESQRSEKYKNKNIYDAYTSYLEYDNIEKLLKYSEKDMISSEEDLHDIIDNMDSLDREFEEDIRSIIEDMENLERKWNTISINIHSSKGIFNSIYEYTNLISKKKIEKEEIHKLYESLRKNIDEDLSYDNKDEEKKELLKILEDTLIAVDHVIYDGNKNFDIVLKAKDKDKYYKGDYIEEMLQLRASDIEVYSKN